MALNKMRRCMFCGENYRDQAAHLEKKCWIKKEQDETTKTGE